MENITMHPGFKFFLDGFKPAIVFALKEKENIKTLKDKGYPFTKCISNHIMFFNKNDDMKDFETTFNTGKRLGRPFERNMAIGLALGIPPTAVEFFAKGNLQSWLIIDYYGLTFATVEDQVTENLKWLKKTYKVPKDYPGYIEVVDRRETVYKLQQKDISSFKLMKHTGVFANKQTPIFQVTVQRNYVTTTDYNGIEVTKAIRKMNENKIDKPQLDVWVADKLIHTYTFDKLKEFREKYVK